MEQKLKQVYFFVFQVFFLYCVNSKPSPYVTKIEVVDGHNYVLLCPLAQSHLDDYSISWLCGNKTVNNSHRRSQMGSKLYFRPLQKELDSERCQCIAVQKETGKRVESNLTAFHFNWIRAGNVYLKRVNDQASAKPAITLQCNITGSPKPRNVTWYVGGQRILASRSTKLRGRRVIMKQVRYPTDDGLYTCCATNPFVVGNQICVLPENGFNLNVLDYFPPTLIQAPANVIVNEGSSVTLHCIYKYDPPPEIVWTKKGSNRPLRNITRSGQCRRRCIYAGGTLELHRVRDTTDHDYQCVAKLGGFTSPVHDASVKVAYIRPFGKPSSVNQKKYVDLGRKFEFHCEVPMSLGVPEPEITWIRMRDNKVIEEGVAHVTRLKNTLVIDDFKMEDAGNYMCVARNMAGSVSRNITLVVGEARRFEELHPQTAIEGSNVTWVCPVFEIPLPDVIWIKDGQHLVDVENKVKTSGLKLFLFSVERSDEGRYSCVVISGRIDRSKQRSNSAKLTIRERSLFNPLHDVCFAAGKTTHVTCSVTRDDVSTIRWIKLDGRPGFNGRELRTGRKHFLLFNETQPSDSGMYRCVSNYSGSSRASNVMKLTVVSRIVIPPRNQTAYVSASAWFDCVQDGGNRAVSWDLPPGSSDPHKHMVYPNGSLLIRDVNHKDEGQYTCSFTICDVKVSAVAMLKVVTRPFNEITTPSSTQAPHEEYTAVQTIVLSIVGGVAYLLLMVGLLAYCVRKHRKHSDLKSTKAEEARMLNSGSTFDEKHFDKYEDEVAVVVGDTLLEDMSLLVRDMELLQYPVENICPVTVIGKGDFGDIFLSKAPGLFPDLEDDILVMVKSFDSSLQVASTTRLSLLRGDFYREINLLHRCDHGNIVKLLAVSSHTGHLDPIDYLITEYLEWGILKLCLEASRNKEIARFTKQHKMLMCSQLACALEYLDSVGMRHNDVATRNCVVSSQLLVKLSVLGLNREGFENEYCEFEGKSIPIRWMAPEALFGGEYSSKSDVWSYGVACGEIFSLAQLPYEDLNDHQVIEELSSSNPSLPLPLDGSKRINSLIRKCCQLHPDHRPDIKQISRKLQSILRNGDILSDEATEKSGKTTDDQTDDTEETR